MDFDKFLTDNNASPKFIKIVEARLHTRVGNRMILTDRGNVVHIAVIGPEAQYCIGAIAVNTANSEHAHENAHINRCKTWPRKGSPYCHKCIRVLKDAPLANHPYKCGRCHLHCVKFRGVICNNCRNFRCCDRGTGSIKCGGKMIFLNKHGFCADCGKFKDSTNVAKICEKCSPDGYDPKAEYVNLHGEELDRTYSYVTLHVRSNIVRRGVVIMKSAIYMCPHDPSTYSLCTAAKKSPICRVMDHVGEEICDQCLPLNQCQYRFRKEKCVIDWSCKILSSARSCAICTRVCKCVTCGVAFAENGNSVWWERWMELNGDRACTDNILIQCEKCDIGTSRVMAPSGHFAVVGSIPHPYGHNIGVSFVSAKCTWFKDLLTYDLYHIIQPASLERYRRRRAMILSRLYPASRPKTISLFTFYSAVEFSGGKNTEMCIRECLDDPEFARRLQRLRNYECAASALLYTAGLPRDIRRIILGTLEPSSRIKLRVRTPI